MKGYPDCPALHLPIDDNISKSVSMPWGKSAGKRQTQENRSGESGTFLFCGIRNWMIPMEKKRRGSNNPIDIPFVSAMKKKLYGK